MTYGRSFKPNSLLGALNRDSAARQEHQIGAKRETNFNSSNEPMRKRSGSNHFRMPSEEKEPWMCMDFHLRGTCMRGDKCKFVHDKSVSSPKKREEGNGADTSEQQLVEGAASSRMEVAEHVAPPQEIISPLAEVFRSFLSIDPFKQGQENVEKLRSVFATLRGVFVLLKTNPRPAIICREMLRHPERREGRAANVKEIACLQFGIEKPETVHLMVEVGDDLIQCIDSLVSFVHGEKAETLFLVPSTASSL